MIDTAFFTVISGKGGNGSWSYRREKYMPKGGPDGGDGGNGGSLVIVGDSHKNTLRDFAGKSKFEAESGENGGKKNCHGAHANDLEIRVPLGTMVWEVTNGDEVRAHKAEPEKKLLGEILEDGEKHVLVAGGRGGRGNVHFKSATNRTPLEYEEGGEPQVKDIFLELKLLADVGFVGFPNAGKSTLLSVLTKAQPKIANYPFTTLAPYLGVLEMRREGKSDEPIRLVLADIPGLIEDASKGKGLGIQFLRHVERCRVLIFLLSLDDSVALDESISAAQKAQLLHDQHKLLEDELIAYNPELANKTQLVVLNKLDLYDEESKNTILKAFPDAQPISAALRSGIEELKARLLEVMQAEWQRAAEAEEKQRTNLLPIYGYNFGLDDVETVQGRVMFPSVRANRARVAKRDKIA